MGTDSWLSLASTYQTLGIVHVIFLRDSENICYVYNPINYVSQWIINGIPILMGCDYLVDS